MIATKQMQVRANIKKYFDMAFDGEPVIVSRKDNKNVVIISEAEYNELAKAKKNTEYLAKLNRADEQIKNGKVVTKTMDELLAMEDQPMKITFAEDGWSEYLYWQTQDKKVIKKINQLLQSIERDGARIGWSMKFLTTK